MDITGILKAKFETQQVSEKFKKREFVLTIEPGSPYPQFVSFQLVQDKCNLIDGFNEGDELKVYFNLRGREWKSPQGDIRYFNTIDAWRIEKVGANTSAPTQSAPASTQNDNSAPVFTTNIPDDDLPF